MYLVYMCPADVVTGGSDIKVTFLVFIPYKNVLDLDGNFSYTGEHNLNTNSTQALTITSISNISLSVNFISKNSHSGQIQKGRKVTEKRKLVSDKTDFEISSWYHFSGCSSLQNEM